LEVTIKQRSNLISVKTFNETDSIVNDIQVDASGRLIEDYISMFRPVASRRYRPGVKARTEICLTRTSIDKSQFRDRIGE
jgi:hypothetical protein